MWEGGGRKRGYFACFPLGLMLNTGGVGVAEKNRAIL